MIERALYLGGHLSVSARARVVADDGRGRLSWLPVGAPGWTADLPGGLHLRDVPVAERPAGGFPVREERWWRGNSLILEPHGAGHAVWWAFDEELCFGWWYVNLEARRERVVGNGFGVTVDVVDHELDVWVDPDRTWRWKDEESFEAKTGTEGHWTAAEADRVRAEGARVAALAEAGSFPFDGAFVDFRPDPSWEPPVPGPCPPVLLARSRR